MRDTGEYLFTSESVSEGHPDKVADRISDTVLDAFLAADPYARVACETLVTTNRVVLAGETRGPETVTPELLTHLTRMAIRDIGYEQEGFHWATADVAVHLHSQSSRHRPGRRQRRQQGRRRRRPGHHVRLCLSGNRDPDAGSAVLLARNPANHPRSAEGRRHLGEGTGAGRQKPGHPSLCRWQAGWRDLGRGVHPASKQEWSRPRSSACCGRWWRAFCRRAGCATKTNSTLIQRVTSSSAAPTGTVA